MPRLYPVTKNKVDAAWGIHERLKGHLSGDESEKEWTQFDRIMQAVEIGRKKHIMTEQIIRSMCDEYIARYNSK